MEWQPIETAPRDRTVVLLLNDGVVCAGFYKKGYSGGYPWVFIDTNLIGEWLNGYQDGRPYGPSHWMPLPEPPK